MARPRRLLRRSLHMRLGCLGTYRPSLCVTTNFWPESSEFVRSSIGPIWVSAMLLLLPNYRNSAKPSLFSPLACLQAARALAPTLLQTCQHGWVACQPTRPQDPGPQPTKRGKLSEQRRQRGQRLAVRASWPADLRKPPGERFRGSCASLLPAKEPKLGEWGMLENTEIINLWRKSLKRVQQFDVETLRRVERFGVDYKFRAAVEPASRRIVVTDSGRGGMAMPQATVTLTASHGELAREYSAKTARNLAPS